jgi:hypothetical protein
LKNHTSNFLVVGTALSIGMGYLGLMTKETIIYAIIITLLGEIVTLLIEIIKRFTEGKQQILDVIPLAMDISKDDDLKSNIVSITNFYSTISSISQQKHHELFISERNRALRTCRETLKFLVDGTFLIDEERRMSILIDILNGCRKGDIVYATSYVNLSDWWYKDLGQRYLQANYDAIKKGVRIERIFILREDETKGVYEFMKNQNNGGIRACIVNESNIKSNLKENFFLIKDSILSYSEYSRDGQLIRGYISKDPRKHDEYFEKFEQLKNHSHTSETLDLPSEIQNKHSFKV